jgi:hypothetical protein
MEDAKSPAYTFERTADGWMLVPSTALVVAMTGGFGAGTFFLVFLSTRFFGSANPWFGAIFLVVAAFSAALGIRAWRSRHTPLKIDPGGRVSYGVQELCAAGTARGVRIVPARSGEAGDCEVCIELMDGHLVSIPSQYFAVFSRREHALPFATALAKALGVQAPS